MKYVADALTLLRVVLAIAVGVAIWQDAWVLATTLFVVGILSDAFDGPAARKWPYSAEENAKLFWRNDPHVLDNTADLALSTAGLLGVTFMLLSFWAAVGVIAAVALTSLCFAQVVGIVGKTNPKRAEKIDVVHGWIYGTELTTMLIVMTIQATDAWGYPIALYAICGLPLLWFKRDRIMSRAELTYGG